MNRIRRVSFLLGLSAFIALPLAAQQREAPPVKSAMISPNLYELLDGQGARGGFYAGDDGVLLIDTKMDQKSMEQALEEIRRHTGKPLRYVVNTHSDGDHIRGNRYLPAGVVIIAHENCRKEFFHPSRTGAPSEWLQPELAPYLPAITFGDRLDLYLGSKKVELHYFGVGHTTGDAVVYFPEEKAAFLGDQLFVGRPPLIHAYKGGNSQGNVRVLARMLEALPAEKFFSGHSEMLDRAGVQDYIARMKQRQEKIGALVRQDKPLAEIQAAFPKNEAALVEIIYNEFRQVRP